MSARIAGTWRGLAPLRRRKRDKRATPRRCKDCGKAGWGSRSWSQNTARCQGCRAARRAAREAREREMLRLRAAGLSYYRIAQRLDSEMGTIWRVVKREERKAA